MEFDYNLLKNEIGFPVFIEENIIKIEDGMCFKQLIFSFKGSFYEIEGFALPVDKHNEYDLFFASQGIIKCNEVERVEIVSHTWRKKDSIDELDKKIEDLRKDLSLELERLSMNSLGEIIVSFGNKYRGLTVKEIHNKDKKYIEWLRDNPPQYNVINDYVRDKERSRLALILYMDSLEFLYQQGR